MLVEINLLPKNDSKNVPLKTLIIIIVTIIFLAMGYMLYKTYAINQHIILLEKELSQLVIDRQQLQGELTIDEDVIVNNALINQLLLNDFSPIPVINQFVSLLPTNGDILALDYSTEEVKMMLVRFSTLDQVARYLNSLTEIEWVSSAELISVSMEDLGNDKVYVTTFSVTLDTTFLKQQAGE